jgi:hypothetical protein
MGTFGAERTAGQRRPETASKFCFAYPRPCQNPFFSFDLHFFALKIEFVLSSFSAQKYAKFCVFNKSLS